MSTIASSTVREYDTKSPSKEKTETATFALGCFWGPDAKFGALEGVIRTRVGYAGGKKTNPTYRSLGDHTETFQVDYDPKEVTYGELLEMFFENHSPQRKVRKTQYQNVVFTSEKRHRDTVEAYLEKSGLDAEALETRIQSLSEFYPAEDYHQKHSLRSRDDLLEPFGEAGCDDEDFRESPAAAKLNGFASGHGLPEGLEPVLGE